MSERNRYGSLQNGRRKLKTNVNKAVDNMKKAFKEAITKTEQTIEAAVTLLETVRDGEQERYDNLSEASQEGERGEAIMENIDALEEAIENIQAGLESIYNIDIDA